MEIRILFNVIENFKNSSIDFNCIFNNNTKLEGYNIVYSGADITNSFIGLGSYIGSNSNLSNCILGRFCSIGSNVHVQPFTHPTSFVSTNPTFFNTINNMPFGKGKIEFKEILTCKSGRYLEIGNDVWIGENVTIRGGVKIGDGAIIGMGAVVTKDVPPYSIVGGVPAKVIKYRFSEDIISKFLTIKWWDWDVEIIKERRNEFVDAKVFVDKYY